MIEGSTIILTIIIAFVTMLVLWMIIRPIIVKYTNTCPGPVVRDEPKKVVPQEDCECVSECYGGCEGGGTSKVILLSRGKPVKMDPEWQSYPASNLTDGDYSTFAHSADWISTQNVTAEIDLGSLYTIRKVKIFNRMDCCQDRFQIHKLLIDDKEVGLGNAKGAWEYQYCLNVKGQKVKIMMDGILNLGEIEVWGY
jgi:hypothetical protein